MKPTVMNRWILTVFLLAISYIVNAQCSAEFSYNIQSDTVNFTNLSVGVHPINYYWDFGDSTTSILENPKKHFYIDGAYNVCLTITDSTACQDTFCSIINICGMDCVWPGDANKDGTANVWDLLPIGVAYNEQGSDRFDQSINWEGKFADDWLKSFTDTTINYKNADCNGSGLINLSDVDAIIENYGMTHNKTSTQGSSGAVNLIITMDKDSVVQGDSINVEFSLGDDLNIANQVYGMAFCINYDPALIDSGTFKINFDSSWFGGPNSSINLYYDQFNSGQIDIGMVRKNKKTKSGKGKVATGTFFIEDNIDGKNPGSWILNLDPCNIVVIDSIQNKINVGVIADSLLIAGIREQEITNWQDEIKVYPNPVTEELTIESTNYTIDNIKIMNVIGRVVYEKENATKRIFKIDVSEMYTGVYFLSMQFKNSTIIRKLVVRN